MKNMNIKAEKITKPIQLLSAWLVGLILIDYLFLYYAKSFEETKWVTAILVISSIINVFIFLIAMFLLQTKFRPEMQGDSYYSKYLENKRTQSSTTINPEANIIINEKIDTVKKQITTLTNSKQSSDYVEKVQDTINDMISLNYNTIQLNIKLPMFDKIIKKFKENNIVIREFFGTDTENIPQGLKVVIGKGFDIYQLKKILSILLEIDNGYILYVRDEEIENKFDNKMLIGTYGSGYVVKIDEAVKVLNAGISINNFYDMIAEKRDDEF